MTFSKKSLGDKIKDSLELKKAHRELDEVLEELRLATEIKEEFVMKDECKVHNYNLDGTICLCNDCIEHPKMKQNVDILYGVIVMESVGHDNE